MNWWPGSYVRRAWDGWRLDGWSKTVDRSWDFMRRRLPWMPHHELIRVGADVVASLTRLPTVEHPLASIVVPVFNKVEYTLECLAALAACGDVCPFEVIVVDDGSSDATAERVSALQGVRYLRNPSNEGFIGSCNRGAGAARGEFLVFLNNDTAVQPGWLDALLATFRVRGDAGLAGAKLLYADGMLQEAGGILYSDGRAGNYGRFDAALDPRYTHVREVDYCSGAAIAIPRVLFEQLGGFDDRYRPAYYEDADLAMRVREAGHSVLYQPRSVVIHFEGITSGTSETDGVKAYQVRNRDVFVQRWAEVLRRDHPSWGTPLDEAASRPCRRTLVAFCDADSAVRSAGLVGRLQQQGRPLMVRIEQGMLPPQLQHEWEAQGVEIWSGYWLVGLRGWMRRHRARIAEIRVVDSVSARSFGRLLGARSPVPVVLDTEA
ncbi:MAG: glycosyltransferase family 2 protein [Rhodanobacter sp.]|nr:glycosyltransferase family 2 protein [Rhodanobacter sp.]